MTDRPPPYAKPAGAMAIWPWLAGFLLVGYLTFARSFAYLGVAPVFIGEVVLAGFLLLKPRIALGTFATALLRPSTASPSRCSRS